VSRDGNTVNFKTAGGNQDQYQIVDASIAEGKWVIIVKGRFFPSWPFYDCLYEIEMVMIIKLSCITNVVCKMNDLSSPQF